MTKEKHNRLLYTLSPRNQENVQLGSGSPEISRVRKQAGCRVCRLFYRLRTPFVLVDPLCHCHATAALRPSLLAMKLRISPRSYGFSARIGWFVAGLLISVGVGVVTAVAPAYSEDLTLERLGKNHVAAQFVFRSRWVPQARHRCQDHEDWHEGGGTESGLESAGVEGGKLCHFEAVFPRAVGVLLDRFKARFAWLGGAAELLQYCCA